MAMPFATFAFLDKHSLGVSRMARTTAGVIALPAVRGVSWKSGREKAAVATVRIRFPAFVFKTPAGESGGLVVVERDIQDGASVAGLLADLVATYPGFREAVYNPESAVMSEQIGVVLNGQLLSFSEISEAKLSNGDQVLVQPIYSGG